MSVTMAEVRAKLEPEEPDYTAAAGLGEDALPHLEELASGPDASLAAKATALVSRIGGRRAAPILRRVARRALPILRVQVAAGARRMPRDEAAEILMILVGDQDSGVRKAALRSARIRFGDGPLPPPLRDRIALVASADPAPFVRELAGELMQR